MARASFSRAFRFDDGKPSLVCDLMEIYRYLIDDFVLKEAMKLTKKDLALKDENFSVSRKGKREYLTKEKNTEFLKKLNKLFTSKVDIPRIKVGSKQEIETLINEEAFLLASYLRGEKPTWIPRIAELK
jgi:CRISPR/Cas system-associated endonuclease Cas1